MASAVIKTRAPQRNHAVKRWAWKHRRGIYVVVIVSVCLFSGVLYVFQHVTLPADVVQAQSTLLFDTKGRSLATLDDGETRTYVTLDKVPQIVQDAVVVREDRSFYSNRGVDPIGILRASWHDITAGRAVEGGSTITQQYVKNVYVGNKRNLLRKIREAAIAMRIESQLSKSQILERYLNAIYFGRGAYGVSAAAHAYFNKDISDLGLNEAAYLAVLVREPNVADVDRNYNLATDRRNNALTQLKNAHKISLQAFDAAKAVPLSSFVIKSSQREPTVALPQKGTQYFVDQVRQELVRRFGQDAVLRGGLRVTTTLDETTQSQAYDAVYGFLRPKEPAGALVSVNSAGEVVAMVGGRDWTQSKVNLAIGSNGGGSGRQAGSTFKAVALAEFVREGYSVESTFAGPAQLTIPKGDAGRDWSVSNFENENFDRLNVIDATADSVNTVYAQIGQRLGATNIVNMAKSLGISSNLPAVNSLVLGSADVSPIDMAGAYSTFADRGIHIEPHLIKEVRTSDGRLLSGSAPKESRVLTASQADTVTAALQTVVQRGTGTGAAYGGPAAGKTGTTTDYGDAWFVGYAPTLTTAVWMGYPEGRSHQMTNVRGVKVAGGTFPSTIWKRFMTSWTAKFSPPLFPSGVQFGGRVMNGPDMTTTSTSVVFPAPAGENSSPSSVSTPPSSG